MVIIELMMKLMVVETAPETTVADLLRFQHIITNEPLNYMLG